MKHLRFLRILGDRLDAQSDPVGNWKLVRIANAIYEAKRVEELAAACIDNQLKKSAPLVGAQLEVTKCFTFGISQFLVRWVGGSKW